MEKKKNRFEKVGDIFKITKEQNLNASTMVFLLATMTDKALTKFHKELTDKYGDIKTENPS